MTVCVLLGTLLPKSTAESLRLDMPIGDMLARLAKNETLSLFEIEELRLWGNQTQTNNSFVAGLQNGSSNVYSNTLNSNTLPFSPIYNEILSVATSSITVQIPSNFNHLFCIGSGRCTGATYNEGVLGRFNSDSGANYDHHWEGGQNTTQLANQSKGATSFPFGDFTAASATSGAEGSFFSFIPNIQSSTWKTNLSLRGISEYAAADLVSLLSTAHWRSTSPITSITLFAALSTIEIGSMFGVYGII
jgi:hypothetical protein